MRDWDNIRIFLSVCRHGSLAAAGRAMKLDETTIGRRLKAMEKSLGTRLFDRTAQGLTLTDAAKAVRKAAESAEEAVFSVQGSVKGIDAQPSGFVRVTATETLSTQFIVPGLSEFHKQHPDIHLEVFSGYIALDIARAEADIAVRALPPVGEHLVSRKLGKVTLAVYASPSYLKQKPVGDFKDGLIGHDLIDFSDLMFPRPPGSAFLGAKTDNSKLVFTSNSPLSLTIAAENGVGIATLPCYLAEKRPDLVRIWPDLFQQYDLLAVMRREVKSAARIRAVVDFLARHFRARQAQLEGH